MSAAYRSTDWARLGAEPGGPLEPVLRVGMALQSALDASQVIGRFTELVALLLRAERCQILEASDPADPLHPLLHEAFSKKAAVQAEGPRSILCAPLFVETHPEGAIVAERSAGSPFESADLRLLAAVAPQVALAIRRARVYDRATSDGLTGLPNRQRFTVELEDAVTTGGRIALILADFDHFKDKNEVYGRPVGDRVLAEFGGFAHARLPGALCLARLGDDEFGALLPEGASRALEIAEDLRQAAHHRVFDEAHEGIHLTVSLGVAEFKIGEMASSLFGRASDALASAKRGGRNRVEVAR